MIDPRKVQDAVLALLRATHPPDTGGARVGDGEAPPDITAPYAILYGSPGEQHWGGFSQPEEASTLPVIVVSVGDTRQQAQWLSQRFRAALLGRTAGGGPLNVLAGAGWTVIDRTLDAAGGVDPDGSLHSVSDVYRLSVAPA